MIPRLLFVMTVLFLFFMIGYGVAVVLRPKEPAKLETKATFKKRYFIVTYDTGDGRHMTSVETNDGLYFSIKQFIYDTGKECVILFVQELSKEDYDKFYSSFTPDFTLKYDSTPIDYNKIERLQPKEYPGRIKKH